jgi:hypothetical protein
VPAALVRRTEAAPGCGLGDLAIGPRRRDASAYRRDPRRDRGDQPDSRRVVMTAAPDGPLLTAYPARQTFGRTAVVHAVASQRIDLPRLTLGRGEPLCGTFAELQPCPPGLFIEPVTCTRCLAVIDVTQLIIGDQQ